MNLFEILKQFKNIQPDSNFSEISKRAILAAADADQAAWSVTPATPVAPAWTAKRSLLQILEGGMAVALTGFFILILAGGLSGSKLAPIEYSAIDPRGIRAEAQAIDIQIQLANVTYKGSSAESTMPIVGIKRTDSTKSSKSSAPPSSPSSTLSSSTPSSTSGTGSGGGGAGGGADATASTTVVPTITINQALEGLSN